MQVNKRARNRLIGVTAIIIIAAIAVVASTGSQDGAYYRPVGEVVSDAELIGERVSVGGSVVAGSWDKKSNPMRFEIREEGTDDGPIIGVVYNGGVPSTFGDGVVAIVKGELVDDGGVVYIDSDDMITKCPSKYETATGSLTVDKALEQKEGSTFPVSGFVVAGSIQPPGGDVRFVIADEAETATIEVVWEGALPAGMDDGSQVVASGSIENGQFIASDVSLAEAEQ